VLADPWDWSGVPVGAGLDLQVALSGREKAATAAEARKRMKELTRLKDMHAGSHHVTLMCSNCCWIPLLKLLCFILCFVFALIKLIYNVYRICAENKMLTSCSGGWLKWSKSLRIWRQRTRLELEIGKK
jgi:hypothetical protein